MLLGNPNALFFLMEAFGGVADWRAVLVKALYVMSASYFLF